MPVPKLPKNFSKKIEKKIEACQAFLSKSSRVFALSN